MKKDMIYEPIKVCTEENFCQTWLEVHEANEARIREIEEKAISDGTLLYRFLYESVADGKAIYQIIKENKTTVRVRLCSMDGLYDDYIVPQWGAEATIPKSYAESGIRFQDAWRTAVEKNKTKAG